LKNAGTPRGTTGGRQRGGHKTDIVMPRTMPQGAPNTYYGQWLLRFLRNAQRF